MGEGTWGVPAARGAETRQGREAAACSEVASESQIINKPDNEDCAIHLNVVSKVNYKVRTGENRNIDRTMLPSNFLSIYPKHLMFKFL